MKIKNFFKDPANLFLLLFGLFFIGLPFIESAQFKFSLMPFFYFIVILLCLFMASLPEKLFFQCLLFLFLSFCADLILWITTNPLLEKTILTSTYVIHIVLCLIVLGFLIKKMFYSVRKNSQLIKIGLSMYLLIGFLWSLFYSMILIYDRRAFSALMLDQFPFFQFSFSTLTTLKYAQLTPLSPLAVSMASLQVVFGQIFLAVFIARMIAFYVAEHIQR